MKRRKAGSGQQVDAELLPPRDDEDGGLQPEEDYVVGCTGVWGGVGEVYLTMRWGEVCAAAIQPPVHAPSLPSAHPLHAPCLPSIHPLQAPYLPSTHPLHAPYLPSTPASPPLPTLCFPLSCPLSMFSASPSPPLCCPLYMFLASPSPPLPCSALPLPCLCA